MRFTIDARRVAGQPGDLTPPGECMTALVIDGSGTARPCGVPGLLEPNDRPRGERQE